MNRSSHRELEPFLHMQTVPTPWGGIVLFIMNTTPDEIEAELRLERVVGKEVEVS
jgi:hypothetical protein